MIGDGAATKTLFLGTGIMGAPMVRRLCAAGISVLAWNRDPSKAEALADAGATPLTDLRSLEPERHIVMLMVSTGDVVDAILFGQAAGRPVADMLLPGSTVIVLSSIPVQQARAQAERLASAGIAYIDAPVSGGEAGAIAGTLSIMAGGDPETVKNMAHMFAPLGVVTHIGPVGTGSLAKLANQAIVGISIGAVAEAFALAELGGADLSAVREALSGGFAGSAILRQHGARMIEHRFLPGAHVETQIKDLTTALAFGEEAGGNFPILSLCTELYRSLAAVGGASLDHSALYIDARRRAGLGELVE